ncbi:MAG: hypothetical protein A3G32_00190 [Deltaproteobacteria bacterium RIFCSPLOWO2_12_FULL_40_28]|nr:MAG: hypothetical protein A3C45_04680 [Deltaproteobacteria bacterium RIFCSPHIGHO2_02_FULL_40_28]OGQ20567.1 MAG: hypothetical protein A3E27_00955 [Deltaproteobacteria bacterium RIFCSPHIGHO2_12_FULL_40_32]OGQ41237.1 MAG: hypothetical protein A3I69_05770 [Deltaproteobacteria bacterium RIFCSPLOWO2_02_FULL_40_36]OGQ55212.1 MAG: hypothetical protein A3G32_00190 [Deltaproteobacteria bacterium RIFCSPLOWO2_12_FULL_40_28]
MDWSLLGFRGLTQVLNVHPVFVHFPIALFPTAFFFYLIGILRKRNDLLLAGQICLGLGFISTLIAVFTGYVAHDNIPHSQTIHHIMETHEVLGFSSLALVVILIIWSFLKREGKPKVSPLFLVLLGITTLAILQNADLGGRMVFVEGAAVKAMPAKQETQPHHNHAPQHDHHEHEHYHP